MASPETDQWLVAAADRRLGDAGEGQGLAGLSGKFKKFVDTLEFPQVFNAIGGQTCPRRTSLIRGPRARKARRAIVKVQGTAPSCRKRIEGTGFVFARERIMTNAHVVAGITEGWGHRLRGTSMTPRSSSTTPRGTSPSCSSRT